MIHDRILLHLGYIDFLKNLNAAILMSQIHYWYMPSKETGKSKLKIFKDGKWWLAKSESQLIEECRLSRKQIYDSANYLRDMGLLTWELFRFNGKATRHFRCQYLESVPMKERIKFVPTVHNILQYLYLVGFLPLESTDAPAENTDPHEENSHHLQESVHLSQVKLITDNTADSTAETTTDITLAQGATANSSTIQFQDHPENIKTYKGPTKANVAITKNIEGTCKVTPKKASVSTMINIWLDTVPNIYPEAQFEDEFSVEEKNMLEELIDKWGGFDNLHVHEMFGLILCSWSEFTNYCKTNSEVLDAPALPRLDFLIAYSEEARNMYLYHCQ